MTDYDRLLQIVEVHGLANINEIAASFYGLLMGGAAYSPVPRPPTEPEMRRVRRLVAQGRVEGKIEKLGSGRWTQYQGARD